MTLQEPLKILSLDGGGIRGLSILLILEDIMEKIRDKNGLDHVPRPCEHFDLIGGTGTGGIIAIMLGRLRMTVDECIKEYRDLAKRAFTPKTMWKSILSSPFGSIFSAEHLEDAVKSTTRRFCMEEECKVRPSEDPSAAQTCPHDNILFLDKTCTRTVVLAITRDNIDAPPTLFRTYDASTAFESCTVWEVARATSAAVGFFEPIRLGRDGIEFVDAAFGYNNPCEVLVQEGRKVFPERRLLRIVSIGTGLGDVITIENSSESIVKALKSMATSSKRADRNLSAWFEHDDQYFRFNVDQGLKDITLSDWEKASTISAHTRNYLAENERAIRKFVDSLFKTASIGGDEHKPASERIHFAVPFPRNKNFVGRQSIIKHLLSIVPPHADADDCQRTAVVGLGGVGKTQIALEVAYRVRERLPDCSVFWVPTIDAVSFKNAYRKIGQLLEVPGINDDEADVEELVKSALSDESAGSWLLIVDNADNSDLFSGDTNLARYLPSSRQGSLLFTSRNRELIVELGITALNTVDVDSMSEEEGLEFLEMHLTKDQISNSDDTAKLLDVLGYLPLAIRQAAAYMAKKQISTTNHRYEEAQNPIATTWLISFRHVTDHDPLAADYLKFLCFLNEKGIPRSLLPGDPWTLDAEDALGTLKAYAFITERKDSDMYDMHRLVRLAMMNWLDKEGELEEWATKVFRRVEEAFPSPRYNNIAEWIGYLPHAKQILERETIAEDGMSDLLFKVGRGYQILGQYRQAEAMHRRALKGREAALGPDHLDTLAGVDNLGATLRHQGQYKKAEEMHRRALEGREKVLGPNHADTITSVNNLGSDLWYQGKYDKSEPMHRRVLEIREKMLGFDHPDTLASVSILGVTLGALGQCEEAEAMLRRALEGREKTLGPDHPDTLASFCFLGRILLIRGQIDEASSMHRRALEGREKVLGSDHPRTLSSVRDMGDVLQNQGQYEKAEAMYLRALEGQEKVLGADHPDTLACVSGLANVLYSRGEYERADAMNWRALEGQEKILGHDHLETLATVYRLGITLVRQGKHERAEAMFRWELEGREKVQGGDHPETLISLHNLGCVLVRLRQHERATEMFERALEGREKTLGFYHPDTLASVDNLGVALVKLGQYEKAESLFRRALEEREKVLGPDHPDTIISAQHLSWVLNKQKKNKGTEGFRQRLRKLF
ncbi:hypothetical protein VTN49DRAFT_2122 [Thermomyces lanuginosus]|uniref:uncharacterized protein n=1 Tax=Thermomyces lanuginosus TaxID=5541 RepID=UPI003742FFBB